MIKYDFGNITEKAGGRTVCLVLPVKGVLVKEIFTISFSYNYEISSRPDIDNPDILPIQADTFRTGRCVAVIGPAYTLPDTNVIFDTDTSETEFRNLGYSKIIWDMLVKSTGPNHFEFGPDTYLVGQRDEAVNIFLMPAYEAASVARFNWDNYIMRTLSVTGRYVETTHDKLMKTLPGKS